MDLQHEGILLERRQHFYIREIFEDAYRIALPFLDPKQGVGGVSLEHHVFVVLHETFPSLNQSHLSILVNALERIFHERNQAG